MWRVPILLKLSLLCPTDKLLMTRLALFVTLATQPSEVFYRALVPFRPSVIRIVPSIIFLFVQRNATHIARVKEEGHPKNLTSQWWRTRASFFVPWRLRRQKKKEARKGTFNRGNSLGRIIFSEYCLLHFVLCQLAKSYLFASTYYLSTKKLIIQYLSTNF